jgi:bifunctional DNase/RNase
MELLGVQLEMPSEAPMMLLREAGGERRVLPVYIDTPEARSIHLGLDKVKVARPLTHDLLKLVLDDLGATVVSVTVTELRERTFYAELVLEVAGERHVISCRPSDGVAIAVRTDTPIYAAEAVLDEAGQVIVDDASISEEDSEELLDEFKRFIEDVTPEDFGEQG